MSREDRENRRERREREGSTSRDANHRSGGDWTTISIPEGISVFVPKEGTYRFDIVPYKVGKGNKYAREGRWYWERSFFVHQRVGPNNESWTCPAKTADLPCPICEYRTQLAKDPKGNQDLVKKLRPKERQLFLIHEIIKNEDKPVVQLYESSYKTFGELLDTNRKDAEDDEVHIVEFDDETAGSYLKCFYREKDAGDFKYIECYKIEFKPRPDGLEEELLQHGICLDEVVKILPYDKLKSLFHQEPLDDEDEPRSRRSRDDDDDDEPRSKRRSHSDDDDDKPSPKRRDKDDDDEPRSRRSRDDDDDDEPRSKRQEKEADDDEPPKKESKKIPTASEMGLSEGDRVRHRKYGLCEIARISKDGTSLVIRDDNDNVYTAIGADELRKEEPKPKKVDAEAESPPSRKQSESAKSAEKSTQEDRKPAAQGTKTTSRSDDDDDDDKPSPKRRDKDDDDEPRSRRSRDDDDDDEPPRRSKRSSREEDWD